jgi:molybdenum cofactor cytidylyltransferase
MKVKFPDFAAVILAAGSSTRMGHPKALLRIGSEYFITHILRNLDALHLRHIVVMLGEHADLIGAALPETMPVHRVVNPEPERGQLSSIQIAIGHLEPDVRGMLVVLVDHPLVRNETYRQILEAAAGKPDRIILPNHNGRNGHPVFFGKRFFPELTQAPMDEGARHVVRQNRSQLISIPVADPGILRDIDDPESYREYITKGK